ncbi:MAG: ABC transporter ATP-binding protein [Caulobacteraceae bacterium]|nr:ABC transporter ATP-binding protein [Caulobacteraceae bacterium]
MSLLRLSGVEARRGHTAILSGVSLDVAPGEIVGLVGSNGSGKTTLMRTALGLMRPAAGRIELGGAPMERLSEPERARIVGYLPQERRIGWNLAAWRIAALGAPAHRGDAGRAAALQALARVGLSEIARRGVLELSGGERGRVLLARLLATGAPLLVADEPAAGLDPDAQLRALDLLREEAARGAGVLVSLHDLGLAARSCDRLAVLHAGRLAALGPPTEALGRPTLLSAFGLDGELRETEAGLVLAARRAQFSAGVAGA